MGKRLHIARNEYETICLCAIGFALESPEEMTLPLCKTCERMGKRQKEAKE